MTRTNTYLERSKFIPNQLAKQLLLLMEEKKTNLALSADVTTQAQLLKLADELGPEICILKTHIDILNDFDSTFIEKLSDLSRKHLFFIFEDRKFADIGNTTKQQYQGGMYRIADWAHFVTAHALPGPGVLQGLKEGAAEQQRGCFLLAQMSSDKNLLDTTYTNATLEMAKNHHNFVSGFISQKRLMESPDFIYLTPGISLAEHSDCLGQNYITPHSAIIDNGSDIIIVGRGICAAPDPLAAAKLFRRMGWSAYLEKSFRLSN